MPETSLVWIPSNATEWQYPRALNDELSGQVALRPAVTVSYFTTVKALSGNDLRAFNLSDNPRQRDPQFKRIKNPRAEANSRPR